MQRADSLEKTLMLGKIESKQKVGRGRGGGATGDEMLGWHHWLSRWVWANSGRYWRSGKPGMLQFMGSQRVRQYLETKQQLSMHFPGGPVVKYRGQGFNPWYRKTPSAMGPLSPCATTTEPTCPKAPALQHEEPPQREDCTPQLESRPHSLQLEKVLAQQWRPSAAKTKIKKKKKPIM